MHDDESNGESLRIAMKRKHFLLFVYVGLCPFLLSLSVCSLLAVPVSISVISLFCFPPVALSGA